MVLKRIKNIQNQVFSPDLGHFGPVLNTFQNRMKSKPVMQQFLYVSGIPPSRILIPTAHQEKKRKFNKVQSDYHGLIGN